MSVIKYALQCGLISIAAMSLVLQTGCKTSESASVTVSSNGTVSGTIKFTVSSKIVSAYVTPAEIQSIPPSSYTIIASVPSANFSSNTSSPTQTTFTAVTDNGYSASATVDLVPVASTTPPANSGDTVYTFAVQNTPELSTWVQEVAAHTTSTFKLTSSTQIPLLSSGTPGNYTISVQINSNETGVVNEGSAAITIPRAEGCNPYNHAICEPKG